MAGSVTNAGFLARLTAHEGFARGDVDTGLIDRELEALTGRKVVQENELFGVVVEVLGDLGWRMTDERPIEEAGRDKRAIEIDIAPAGEETTPFRVASVQSRERKKNPAPPFITSKLQQDAARKLGWTARRTMNIAQQLYEGVELGSGSVPRMRGGSRPAPCVRPRYAARRGARPAGRARPCTACGRLHRPASVSGRATLAGSRPSKCFTAR